MKTQGVGRWNLAGQSEGQVNIDLQLVFELSYQEGNHWNLLSIYSHWSDA